MRIYNFSIYYYIKKRYVNQVDSDLAKHGYNPKWGGPSGTFLRLIEVANSPQEKKLIIEDVARIIGDRGKLLLVT